MPMQKLNFFPKASVAGTDSIFGKVKFPQFHNGRSRLKFSLYHHKIHRILHCRIVLYSFYISNKMYQLRCMSNHIERVICLLTFVQLLRENSQNCPRYNCTLLVLHFQQKTMNFLIFIFFDQFKQNIEMFTSFHLKVQSCLQLLFSQQKFSIFIKIFIEQSKIILITTNMTTTSYFHYSVFRERELE